MIVRVGGVIHNEEGDMTQTAISVSVRSNKIQLK